MDTDPAAPRVAASAPGTGDSPLRPLRAGALFGAIATTVGASLWILLYITEGFGGRMTFGIFIYELIGSSVGAAIVAGFGIIYVASTSRPRRPGFVIMGSLLVLVLPGLIVVSGGPPWWYFYPAFLPGGAIVALHIVLLEPASRLPELVPRSLVVIAIAGSLGPVILVWGLLSFQEPEFTRALGVALSAIAIGCDIILFVSGTVRLGRMRSAIAPPTGL